MCSSDLCMPDTASQPATEPEILPCTARKFSRQVNCNWVHPGASPCDARRKARAVAYPWPGSSGASRTGSRRFSRRFSMPFDDAKWPPVARGAVLEGAPASGIHHEDTKSAKRRYSTMRRRPCLRIGTWKLMSNPTCLPLNRRQVRSWASWIGSRASTAFNSTIRLSSTSTSIRQPSGQTFVERVQLRVQLLEDAGFLLPNQREIGRAHV